MTSTFVVKDMAAFRAALAPFSHIRIIEDQGRVRLYSETADSGIWELTPDDFDWTSDDAPEDHEVDIIQLVQRHLPEGEAAYFITVGTEGTFHLNAYGEAIRGGEENAGHANEISMALDRWLKEEMQALWFGIRMGGEVLRVP